MSKDFQAGHDLVYLCQFVPYFQPRVESADGNLLLLKIVSHSLSHLHLVAVVGKLCHLWVISSLYLINCLAIFSGWAISIFERKAWKRMLLNN